MAMIPINTHGAMLADAAALLVIMAPEMPIMIQNSAASITYPMIPGQNRA